VKPINTGDNQLETNAAVPPANPNRARIPAAVQLGTVAAAPIKAPNMVVVLLSRAAWAHSFSGFTITPQLRHWLLEFGGVSSAASSKRSAIGQRSCRFDP
jgi:hypothetical protein